jgi:hypothetical protein
MDISLFIYKAFMMDYRIYLLETKWNIEITQMEGPSSAKLGWTRLS